MAYNAHFVYPVNQKRTDSRRSRKRNVNLRARLGSVFEKNVKKREHYVKRPLQDCTYCVKVSVNTAKHLANNGESLADLLRITCALIAFSLRFCCAVLYLSLIFSLCSSGFFRVKLSPLRRSRFSLNVFEPCFRNPDCRLERLRVLKLNAPERIIQP